MGKVRVPQDERSLVILPLPISLECPGEEECSLSETDDGCFESLHHLYFYEWLYEKGGPDSLYFQLRNDPVNLVPMARCRHDEFHDGYAPPSFPTKKVVKEFLHQSTKLRSLGDAALELASKEIEARGLLRSENAKRERILRLGELCEIGHEKLGLLSVQVQQAELLPPEASNKLYSNVKKPERQPVRELALQMIRSALELGSFEPALSG